MRRRRALLWGGTAVVVLGVVGGGWVGARGLLAARHLSAARTQLAALERPALERPTGVGSAATALPALPGLPARIAAIGAETRAARRLTSDPIWSLAEHLPVVGCPLRAGSAIIAGTDELAESALPPLAALREQLNPAVIRTGSRIRLEPFLAARAPLDRAVGGLQRSRARLGGTPSCRGIGQRLGLVDAHDQLAAATGRLLTQASDARVAAALVPPMLGEERPRRYLLVVQNDAESRATGGIIGGLGVLVADRGRVRLEHITGNNTLPGGATAAAPAGPVPPDLVSRYGPFAPNRVWANANLTPDYPTASRFYTALYEQATGTRIDGTISIDPTTLAYLIGATGPARLPDGTVLTAADLVGLVESRIYAQIDDSAARDRFFVAVGRAAYDALLSGRGSPRALLDALGRAAGEGRLLVASGVPGEERLLQTTPLGGALPTARGAFLAVVTQNATASKLDYWLRRRVDYRLTRRADGSGDATITVWLTNAAPAALPAYVRLREDPGAPPGNPAAQNNVWVSVYTGIGSGFVDASLDGHPVSLASGTEKGHPVASLYVRVNRTQTRTLVLHVHEPTVGRALTVRPQPLVRPAVLNVTGVPVVGATGDDVE